MLKLYFILVVSILTSQITQAEKLEVGSDAPLFSLPNQENKIFNLIDRKNIGWTVLYFYPKSETPGCTKQACAFRDSIKLIRALNAEVYGISGDQVADQKKFHEKHQLNFDILADPNATIIEKYGAKLPLMKMSKRWTFILDEKLKIRSINRDVDPILDAKEVAATIKVLKSEN